MKPKLINIIHIFIVIIWVFVLQHLFLPENINYKITKPNTNNNSTDNKLPASQIKNLTPTDTNVTNTEINPQNVKNTENHEIIDTLESTSIKLSFVGDILLAGRVEDVINSHGYGFLLDDIKNIFMNRDIVFGNLENPISTRGTKETNKQYTFRGNPKNLNVLIDNNINGVSLANNHILDYGREALIDTMENLNSYNIKYSGAGETIDDAFKPATYNINGKEISIISVSRIIPKTDWNVANQNYGVATTYDSTKTLAKIKEFKKVSDVVIVYVHWGDELSKTPLKYQKVLAKEYIDSGATAVIGSHPHVLQGFEFYKDSIIAYSLGNFIFSGTNRDSAILNIDFSNDTMVSSIIPCEIKNFKPYLINTMDKKKEFFENLKEISFGIDFDSDGTIIKNK